MAMAKAFPDPSRLPALIKLGHLRRNAWAVGIELANLVPMHVDCRAKLSKTQRQTLRLRTKTDIKKKNLLRCRRSCNLCLRRFSDPKLLAPQTGRQQACKPAWLCDVLLFEKSSRVNPNSRRRTQRRGGGGKQLHRTQGNARNSSKTVDFSKKC